MELLSGCLIVNAWVLFNKYHKGSNKLPILKFRESIVLSLLTGSPEDVVKPGRRPVAIERAALHPSGSQHCLFEAEGPKKHPGSAAVAVTRKYLSMKVQRKLPKWPRKSQRIINPATTIPL